MRTLWVAAALALAAFAPVQQDGKAQEKKREPIYDEKADGEQQIASALAKAAKENRRVLIQWGANLWSWCHVLHGLCKKDKDVSRELLYEYDVVLIDVGRRGDKHMDLAAKYGVDLKEGIPYFTLLDADGKVLANQETEVFETKVEGQQGYEPKKLLAFLKEHEAEPWKAEDLLAGALARAKAEDKRVFLHFGAPWWGWCHRMEAWMASKDVAPVLAKEFVELKIDQDRMIGGKDVLARFRKSEKGGIPWFALLDADGNALVDSNGPKGNVGFPYQPDEVEHFGAMLAKSCKRLSPDEIAALTRSLDATREADEKKKAEEKAKKDAGGKRG